MSSNPDSWSQMQDGFQPHLNPHPSARPTNGPGPRGYEGAANPMRPGETEPYDWAQGRPPYAAASGQLSTPVGGYPNPPGGGGYPIAPGSAEIRPPNPPGGGYPMAPGGGEGGPPVPAGAGGRTLINTGGVDSGQRSGGSYPMTSDSGTAPPITPVRAGNPMTSRLGAQTPNSTGGIRPIRGGPVTPIPSASPYTYERPQVREDAAPADHQPAILDDIRHNRSSSNTTITIRAETLRAIRDNVKGLLANVNNKETLIKNAQPLFQLPEQERWAASVVLILKGLQDIGETLTSLTQSTVDNTGSASLNSFVITNLKRVLLQPDLDSFGRVTSLKNRHLKTPFSMVKDLIDKQGDQWIASNLCENWRDNANEVEKVDKLITKRLKGDKSTLATIIRSGLDDPNGVPKLAELVTTVYSQMTPRHKDANCAAVNKDPKITPAAKARLAYLQLIIHINNCRHEAAKGTTTKVPNFWTQIEDDLAARNSKSDLYHYAFSTLIYKKDRALWNGTRIAASVSAEEAALPTEDEIQEKMNERTQAGGQGTTMDDIES
ncbi:hypothetical protein PTTG_08299 [Puccinia triticina 1-1 BBBD Race 1]|uniref:Uncharacterized protein n=1 Tax=Puccinia triticina (isolate 1-1 / race 1 (BBBD)) TaxID=630390 RepID=A0A180GCJ3_PUCT1|nr:hypothetical protein PTTG_08299 [Puccinia triticina 1-1 BBBD Race 1]